MRITNVTISNYRSLGEDVSLTLGNLTALVGPNGSGKSNVVDALRFVVDALNDGLDAAVTNRHGLAAIRRRSAGRSSDVSIHFSVSHEDGQHGTYLVVLGPDKGEGFRVRREHARWVRVLPEFKKSYELYFDARDGRFTSSFVNPRSGSGQVNPHALILPTIWDVDFSELLETLRNIGIYSISPDVLREPQKIDPVRPMREHGENWCSILKDPEQADWTPELVAALGKITGDIDGLRARRLGGYLITEFRHIDRDGSKEMGRSLRWHDAAQESDGTLRLAGILTALLQVPPLTLIVIEEPELTVHPGAIPLLYDYLKEASTRSQVVITTHSPELLALLDADEVRVVERRDGVTTVGPMEESQREAVKDRLLTLGDLMRMEGLRPELPREPAGAGG